MVDFLYAEAEVFTSYVRRLGTRMLACRLSKPATFLKPQTIRALTFVPFGKLAYGETLD